MTISYRWRQNVVPKARLISKNNKLPVICITSLFKRWHFLRSGIDVDGWYETIWCIILVTSFLDTIYSLKDDWSHNLTTNSTKTSTILYASSSTKDRRHLPCIHSYFVSTTQTRRYEGIQRQPCAKFKNWLSHPPITTTYRRATINATIIKDISLESLLKLTEFCMESGIHSCITLTPSWW